MNKTEYSSIYKILYNEGCFNINFFKKRDDFNSKYIWFNEMDWMSINEINNYNYDDGENKNVIPFAKSSNGDLWGWLKDENENNECSVVYCPMDENEGILYAPSFIGSVFRQIFEFASQNNFCDGSDCKEWEMDICIAKNHIKKWIDVFGGFMPISWRFEIENLLNKSLFLYQESTYSKYLVLIPPDEAEAIVKKHLNYPLIDNEFVWICDDN
ncbi:hypothetical protein C0W35_21875 [Photobacterium kishitanii]|uniref:SMI1/KNR4 family protein n=1 Tax=Photobacterium kishitanii TaxID=318456 RepID=UPI000D1550D4|nr:SMI1/KNR4 family protein [Photobacterium kishitanii]PSU87044.1 hypothetical protein C0W35_21875 [Photobacterium kishitanii]